MRRSFAFVVSLCLAAAAHPLPAGAAGRWPRVQLQFSDATSLVSVSLDDAERSLQDEQCRLVFSDFRDQEGRPLTARLDELKVDGPGFLHLVMWAEGDGTVQCGRGYLAYTAPGSRVVFVCSRQFRKAVFGDRDLAQAILIHEALHSLGLGENPPSSQQITRQVKFRCDAARNRRTT
jgi:hypothetical protein